MHYQVEALDAFRHRFEIELDAAEVDTRFSQVYLDFSYRFDFPGHDKGQVPANAIDDEFGADAVAATTADLLCNSAFGRAIGDADLVKIGDPSFSFDAPPSPRSAFCFAAEVDCSPRYELNSYEPVEIRLPAMGNNAGMAPALQKLRENEALHALQQRLEGFIPEVLIDAQEQLQLQEIYAKANAQNIPFETYLVHQRIDPSQFRKDLEQQAEENVRRNLALDAWARHIGVEASDKMIAANFARSAVPFPKLEEAKWRESGRIAELRQAIRRAGALRNIMETLVITTI